MRSSLWLLLPVALLACNTSTDDDDAPVDGGNPRPDMGTVDAGPDDIVEIGTGQDMFMPLMPNQSVDLIQGTQGGGRTLGYHIWSAVQVKGFNPTGAELTFKIIDDTGTEQASQTRVVTLQAAGEFHQAFGIAPRIMDCCSVASKTATLSVSIVDMDGKTGSDSIVVNPGRCIDQNGGVSLCP